MQVSLRKGSAEMRNTCEAVVFDMDGVIFDSERATLECWKKLAVTHGLEDIEKPFRACTGTTMVKTKEIMLDAYGSDFPFDEFAKESSAMYHRLYDGGRLPMKSGVFELLEFLKSKRVKIALASSTRRQTVTNQLKDAGLYDFFDQVVCGDMVEKSKPEPDIYLRACELLEVTPSSAIAIEDSYNGIRSAHAGRLRPIMVPDLLPATDEMREKAECILPDLIAVRDYLAAKLV